MFITPQAFLSPSKPTRSAPCPSPVANRHRHAQTETRVKRGKVCGHPSPGSQLSVPNSLVVATAHRLGRPTASSSAQGVVPSSQASPESGSSALQGTFILGLHLRLPSYSQAWVVEKTEVSRTAGSRIAEQAAPTYPAQRRYWRTNLNPSRPCL